MKQAKLFSMTLLTLTLGPAALADQICSAKCYYPEGRRPTLVYYGSVRMISTDATRAFREISNQCKDGVLAQVKIRKINYYRGPSADYELIEATEQNSCREATDADREPFPRDREGNTIAG